MYSDLLNGERHREPVLNYIYGEHFEDTFSPEADEVITGMDLTDRLRMGGYNSEQWELVCKTLYAQGKNKSPGKMFTPSESLH